MFCMNCGKEIKDSDKFCRFCGTVVSANPETEVSLIKEKSKLPIKVPHKEKEKKGGLISSLTGGINSVMKKRAEAAEQKRLMEIERQKEEERLRAERERMRAALINDIQAGHLPVVVNPPAIMQKNETCHFCANVALFETKTRKKTTYVGGSSGVSLRIAKGVSYRVGSFKGQPITNTWEETVQIDQGTLLFTTKRVMFVGSKKSFSINHNKILNFQMYSDGIDVIKENRKTEQVFKFLEYIDPEITGCLLHKIIEESLS